MKGQPVIAIGNDAGDIETYQVGPKATLTRLGTIEAAHTWLSPNQADRKVFRSSISALEIIANKDGIALASAGWEDKAIKLWDWTTLRERGIMRTHSYVMRLGSKKMGTQPTLISLGMDLRCQFWDPETGALLKTHVDQRVPDARVQYESDSLWYVDMAFGRVGPEDIVVISSRDGTANVINARNLAVLATATVGYGVWGRSIALTSSGIVTIAGARGLTAIKLVGLE